MAGRVKDKDEGVKGSGKGKEGVTYKLSKSVMRGQ